MRHVSAVCPFADLFRTTFPEKSGENMPQKDFLFTNLYENPYFESIQPTN